MGSHDGRIDHEISVLSIRHQVAEDLLPNPAGRPAAEALRHALLLAVTLAKITPVCAGAQDPKHSVDKKTVVRSRPAHRIHPARQQTLDPAPLRITQLTPMQTEQKINTQLHSLYVDTA